MGGLIEAILKFIQSIFGGGSTAIEKQPASGETTDAADTHEHIDGTFPEDFELPSLESHENVPEIEGSQDSAGFAAQSAEDPLFRVQAASTCKVTVRRELGLVNLRIGPSMQFEPPLAKTRGGSVFDLAGASEPDQDNYRWDSGKLANGSGWIRSDLVTLSTACASLGFISAAEVTATQPPPPPTTRFPVPVKGRISQGYKNPSHPGYDLAVDTGYAIISPADGVCIRRIDCTKCTRTKPNRQPNGAFQCPDTWKDPAWGFGYGNFLVIRYDYNVLPPEMRRTMDGLSLRGGYAYILYAHLSRLNARVGQRITKGMAFAATGNTGCSTGPHLHFEVRVGKDENVDNRWSLQRPVNPNLMFAF